MAFDETNAKFPHLEMRHSGLDMREPSEMEIELSQLGGFLSKILADLDRSIKLALTDPIFFHLGTRVVWMLGMGWQNPGLSTGKHE